MSSAVSYANVASQHQPETSNVLETPDFSLSSASPMDALIPESAASPENAHEDPQDSAAPECSATASSEETSSAQPPQPPTAKKEQKALAPAPVPQTLAWGAATSSAASSAASSSIVDEQKWPTPEQGTLIVDSAAKAPRFINPVTTKWVPIQVKVTLPSPSRQQPLKQARPRKPRLGPSAQHKAGAAPSATAPASDAQDDSNLDQSRIQENHQTATSKQNGGSASNTNQKGMRRFPANNGQNQSFQKRYPTPPSSMNGGSFYAPSQYGQGFNGYPNRQFRQNGPRPGRNGQYRAPAGLVVSPHIMHMDPLMFAGQERIPPPISPKQEPREAFILQVDYYFSVENLIRDVFLRKMMNADGYVSLSCILDFKRVQIIINGIQNSIEGPDKQTAALRIVLDAVSEFKNVDVLYAEGKDASNAGVPDISLRVKDNYTQWLMPADS